MDKKDWQRFESLANRVGMGVERVVTLRRRLDPERPRVAATPLTLVVGRGPAGLDLLIQRWAEPDLARLIEDAEAQPVVAGPDPQSIVPKFATWPTYRWDRQIAGHVLFLRTAAPPSRHLYNLIASLGYLDQVVLLSRLFQAMHADERRILQAFAPLAATARVMLVWYPGEEPNDSDLAEVPVFARKHVEASGFQGRCLESCIWYPAQVEPDSRLVDDPSLCLMADITAAANGRAQMAKVAVSRLLQEIHDVAGDEELATVEELPAEETERLSKELASFLRSLKAKSDRILAERPTYGVDQLRTYVLDAIRGWGAYTTIEGHWMKYVETVRPGLQQGLNECVDAAVSCIDTQAPVDVADSKPEPQDVVADSSLGLVDRLMLEAKRLGVGLLLGILAAGFLPGLVSLPRIADELASLAFLGIGTVLGYGIALMLIRPPPRSTGREQEEANKPSIEVFGWDQFQSRVESWFAENIRADQSSALEQSKELAEHLGFKIEVKQS